MEKPEYMVMNDVEQYSLYRKLLPGEYVWYRSELHRIKMFEKNLWLRLDTNKNKEVLQVELRRLNKTNL